MARLRAEMRAKQLKELPTIMAYLTAATFIFYLGLQAIIIITNIPYLIWGIMIIVPTWLIVGWTLFILQKGARIMDDKGVIYWEAILHILAACSIFYCSFLLLSKLL